MASSCAHYRTTATTTLAGAALATRAYAFSSMPLSSCMGRTAAAAARSRRSPGAVVLPAWQSAARRPASSSSSRAAGKRTPPPPPKPLPYHAKKKETTTTTTTTTSLPSSLAPATERWPAAAAAPPSPTSPKRAPPGGGGPSSSSSSSKAEPVDQLVRSRWIGIFGMGAAALCLGSFSASLWLANSAPPPAYTTGCEPGVPTGRPAIESPVEFDLHLDKSEWRSGITALRRRLAARARGHVLEVAFGTGRNVEFYDWAFADAAGEGPDPQADKKEKKKTPAAAAAAAAAEAEGLRSFTGIDISPAMLDLGLRRLRQNVPAAAGLADALPKQPSFAALAAADPDPDAGAGGGGCVRLLDGRLRVYAADAQDALPAPPGAEPYYDTVVQTFGLCSVRDPARLLRALAAAVRPGTGRILLLEHGRSDWWDGVNRMLDRSARGHFERFGCWWNRDIERLVRDAQEHVPGLELVALERPGWATFGTHVWVELRVRPTAPVAPEKAVAAAAAAPTAAGNFLSRLLGSWGSSAK